MFSWAGFPPRESWLHNICTKIVEVHCIIVTCRNYTADDCNAIYACEIRVNASFFWKASRWKDHAYLRTFFHFYASKRAKDARLCEKFYFTRFFQIMRIFKKQPFYAKNYAGIIRPSLTEISLESSRLGEFECEISPG